MIVRAPTTRIVRATMIREVTTTREAKATREATTRKGGDDALRLPVVTAGAANGYGGGG